MHEGHAVAKRVEYFPVAIVLGNAQINAILQLDMEATGHITRMEIES